ncbi:MAG: hypothetical protein LWW95_11870 [Candidatus Desulfofervidus auxilii]|nr:hypothetical protein [Candidatus Desulfofervidus auxilii]
MKSIRVKEEVWEILRQLSKEKNKSLTHILEGALEKYIEEIFRKRAVEKLRNLPNLSLGKEIFTQEEIYEDRY